MNNQKNTIIDHKEIDNWLAQNVTANSKNSLYFDSALFSDPIIKRIVEDDILLRKIGTIIVNGPLPKEAFSHTLVAPKVVVISKKIEISISISLSVGKKTYFYKDTSGVVRTATDDLDIGKILEQIHTGFESLAW